MTPRLPYIDHRHARRAYDLVKACYEQCGVVVTDTEIGRAIANIEWLAERGEALADVPRLSTERFRFWLAWCDLLRLDGVARAFAVCRRFEGFRDLLRRTRYLRTPTVLDAECQPPAWGEAWDRLFEVEVAARLRHTGEVRFAEPDIVVREPEGEYVVACKRPRSADRIASAARRAAAQIVKSGRTGVVLIGLDVDGSPIVAGADAADTAQAAQARIDAATSILREEVSQSMQPHGRAVCGAILMCRVVALQPGPSGFTVFNPRWHFAAIPSDEGPLTATLLEYMSTRMSCQEPPAI